uniref:NADH-ubiquinone oxidoreductase chain 6 n=1 Tax=Muda kuroiwae TaxID=2170272 RepID=A0A344ALV3_9HEMI|nr:NADH dehydrogenase subunit 6 [Muda kuroiwae]
MKIIMYMILLMSFDFLFMKHPLSMGFILLIQTLLCCITSMIYMNNYLFSYMMFLIFVGGMLVLFMYMSSIASNEKFTFSMKLLLMNVFMMLIFLTFNMTDLKLCKYNILIKEFNGNSLYMLNKLYIIPSGMMTLMMLTYLLFVLIVVVNVISIKMCPLRSTF